VISVDGTEISDMYPYLREVQVAMSRRGATTGTLTFDSVRLEDGSWSVQDAGVFEAWKGITIEAAFGDNREEVMRGYIKEVRSEYPEDMSSARVTVSVQDQSLALDREHERRNWSTTDSPMTDGDIASSIASDHDLDSTADPGLTNASLNMDGTYVRFLQDRAEANGFEFYVREGTLYFHAPKLGQNPVSEPIRVYAGAATNCLRFSAQYDGHKPDQVAVTRSAESGTDSDESVYSPNLQLLGTTAANSESRGLPPFVWRMQAPNGATADEVQSRAQAKANENAWKITAEGELDGALYGHVLLTHTLVVVDGAGDTNDGTYYVDEVQHHFSLEGYRQGFKLLRNATGNDSTASAPSPIESVIA